MLTGLFGRSELVGVDVGAHTVKVVQASMPSRHRVRVLGSAEVATPPGSFFEGQVLDSRALGGAIREALAAASITARRAAVAVSTQYGFVRKVSFPTMPVKELRAAIDLQPERYIPLAREGSVYDLHVLPGEQEGQVAAVVAAAPRKNVLDLMDACGFAGLKVVRVDLEPLALHRALVAAGLITPDMSTAVVDLGASAAKISLFEGPVPVITRVVDMPHSEVEGAADPFAGIATQDLFLDIRRSLEFALTQTAARPSRVYIAGGAGSDGYLLLSLTAYLRGFLAHRLPEDFQVAPVHAPLLGLAQPFMLALGLSLLPERLS